MKLVDKSEIIKEAWRVEYKDMFHLTVSEDIVSVNDIEKAPEVDAIPIEWFKKKMDFLFENQIYGAEVYQWVLNRWYEDKENWEKENETNRR